MAGAHRTPAARKRSFGSLVAVLGAMLLFAVGVRAVLGDGGGRSGRSDVRGARSAPQVGSSAGGAGGSGMSEAPGSTMPSPATTSASPTPSQSREPLVIHGTGDVNLDPSSIRNFRTYGYGYAWSGLAGLFQEDDLTVINLECAVSDLGSAAAKEFTFRGDPDALPAARAAGVEVAEPRQQSLAGLRGRGAPRYAGESRGTRHRSGGGGGRPRGGDPPGGLRHQGMEDRGGRFRRGVADR